MAPDRWAPQSWEPPSWDRASWDSASAGPAGWVNPPGSAPDWSEHGDPRGAAPGSYDDLQAGELPPLPPGPMPGSGHPSGPLPPLPESDYLWGEPPSDPPPPAGRRSRRDQDQSRRRSRRGGHGSDPAGLPGTARSAIQKARQATPTTPLATRTIRLATRRSGTNRRTTRAGPAGDAAAVAPNQMSAGVIRGMRATWMTRVTWT